MKMNNISNEKGFVLVSVMVLTLMASTLVLASLQDTTVQERLSGNFQKKINSRMLAEKGVFDALGQMNATIEDKYDADAPLEDILVELIADETGGQEGSTAAAYGYTVEHVSGTDLVTITSAGELYEGKTSLQGVFQLVAGQTSYPTFPYATGITSCKSIDIGASGSVDSYNSALGAYGSTTDGVINQGNEVTVQTLIGGADGGSIDLAGGGTIKGDLLSANDLNITGGLVVTGDVRGQGNMTLSGHNKIDGSVFMLGYYDQIGSGYIGGDLYTNGYASLAQISVTGNITSLGPLTVTGGTNGGDLLSLANITLNQVDVTGDATTHTALYYYGHKLGNAYAGGSIAHPYGTITSKSANMDPSLLPGVPALTYDDVNDPSSVSAGSGTCDADDINTQVADVNAASLELDNLNISVDTNYVMSNTTVSDENKVALTTYLAPTASADFINATYQMFMYDNVHLEGNLSIAANQHVTMYVEGNFTMDNNPTLTIPSESSLTLIIKGQVWIDNGSVETPTKGVTTSGKPAFSIFSSYNSIDSETGIESKGIHFTNGLDKIYAVIHAPLANVVIDSGVVFSGSIYGYNVDVAGAGQLHYDTALEGATLEPIPPSAGAPTIIFQGWKYVTDDETDNAS